ncbi:HNH endonuclease [Arthrobacter sp. OVS8]|nr:HNH endonuclease [Arthrobacter sp. OVS8]
MTAIILGWDPDRWNEWNYAAVVKHVAAMGLHLEPWSVGHHRNIAAGTDAWLLLQGDRGRGLIGHGIVLSEHPEPGPRSPASSGPCRSRPRCPCRWRSMPSCRPASRSPSTFWRRRCPGSRGTVMMPPGWPSTRLRKQSSGPCGVTSGRRRARTPHPGPGTYPRDAVTRVEVNRYEQDPDARRACIAHHGTSCAACGFSFEQKYGQIGRDFIPVHHLVPVSQLGGGYQLDPISDLVPLCANCHAMAHHGVGTPRTVAELRRIIGDAGFLRGTTVSPEELEAQRAARELLGPQ